MQFNKALFFYWKPVCSTCRQNCFIDYTAFDVIFDQTYSLTSIELFQSSTCPDDIRIKTNTLTFLKFVHWLGIFVPDCNSCKWADKCLPKNKRSAALAAHPSHKLHFCLLKIYEVQNSPSIIKVKPRPSLCPEELTYRIFHKQYLWTFSLCAPFPCHRKTS